jgi:hypothetical protein
MTEGRAEGQCNARRKTHDPFAQLSSPEPDRDATPVRAQPQVERLLLDVARSDIDGL